VAAQVAARLGLDRSLYVRFGGGSCEVVGVRHRHPAEVRVPVHYGLDLVDRGMPAVGLRSEPAR
jgi:hypothetical protein